MLYAEQLTFAVGVLGATIVGLIALVVVYDLWTGKIDLANLLSDKPDASLSRFQFLVFTFIIGLSYLLITLKCGKLPDASGALGLLGISASGYVLGKGIQKSADTAVQKAQLQQPAASSGGGAVGPVVPAATPIS
jgi:hypothetical protein